MIEEAIKEKLKGIKLALFDVDGVLTDAKLYFTDGGEEFKSFNARDGLGMKLLMDNGVEVGVITGRHSPSAKARLCDNLNINYYFEGCIDKVSTLNQLIEQKNFKHCQILFVGDDLIDIGVMNQVGVAVAVQNAELVVKEQADIILNNRGGEGAVREICEIILDSQNKWQSIVERFKSGKKYTN